MGYSHSLNISYNKKRTYKSKRYMILIPDDAILQTNVEGGMEQNRDFTAFLSHDKNDNWDQAPVSFSSAGVQHTAEGTNITAEKAYQTCQSMVLVFAATTGDKATVYRYDHGKIHGAICHQKIFDDCSNFHIWAGEDGHMYQFRVIFNVEVPDKQMLDLVKGWLDTMEMTSASTVTKNAQNNRSEGNKKVLRDLVVFFETHCDRAYTIAEMQEDDSIKAHSYSDISQILKEWVKKGCMESVVVKGKTYFASTTSTYELYEEVAKAETELKKAEDNLSECRLKSDSIPELENLLSERKNRYLSQIETAKEAEAAAKKAYDDSVERTEQTMRERKESGLFELDKKKQLKAKIAELKAEALAHQEAITAAQESQEQIRVQIKEDEERTAAEIEKIRSDYSEAQRKVAEAKDKLRPLESQRDYKRRTFGW